VFNFVTKGLCGSQCKISWTQVETGSAVTWKYPSCILKGDNSVGEFYSIAVTNNFQQADTGTKMIHLGKTLQIDHYFQGISAGRSQNSYRGLVRISPNADNARNFSQCDSLLMGDNVVRIHFHISKVKSAKIEHEATTSKLAKTKFSIVTNVESLPKKQLL
jgi:Fe-S cluster assembly protein SufB